MSSAEKVTEPDYTSSTERAAVKAGEAAAMEYTGGRVGVFLSGLTAYRKALRATRTPDAKSEDDVRPQIAECVKEYAESGFWRPCSGCYETEDGYPSGHYPHSPSFGCVLGSGCGECGGIGAVWDTTDYTDFAKFALAVPAPVIVTDDMVSDALAAYYASRGGSDYAYVRANFTEPMRAAIIAALASKPTPAK